MKNIKNKNEINSTEAERKFIFPILPLRDVVIYPNMVLPLFIGRSNSIKSINYSLKNNNRKILLIAQKNFEIEDPVVDDLYRVGTVANILQSIDLPDGSAKILIEGESRAEISSIVLDENGIFFGEGTIVFPEEEVDDPSESDELIKIVMNNFEQFLKLDRRIPIEVLSLLSAIEDPSKFADTVAAYLYLKNVERQNFLETLSPVSRLKKLIELLGQNIEKLQTQKRINLRVKSQMEKAQKEYWLNEQLKAIKKELGDDFSSNDVDDLEKKIEISGMPEDVVVKAKSELVKLKSMPAMSAEATVSRNYLDWIINLPWKNESLINSDIRLAEKILDKEHYALEKVKERIVEYLAVQNRVKKIRGPILCLVGPPGVGKTSLGTSIANATGRKFVRVSLGGIRDEAEIRGHRKTYIGSFPGKIIQGMCKANTKNPLFLLDEIDKMSADFRGDPASALLEVLDPEQNAFFNDHYLEIDFDLSNVMFITTANSTSNILPALLDRMEVIRIEGYTEDEKLMIAKKHLLPKLLEFNGLTDKDIKIQDSSIKNIVRYYTREPGVRNLEREISKILRKIVKMMVTNSPENIEYKNIIRRSDLEKYLGVRKYRFGVAEKQSQIGQVTGLAWTEVGGELLTIEASVMPGKGKIIITGQLGEVMRESIQAAVTVIKSRSKLLKIKISQFDENDIHIHVPEGAIPKDGPSAGIAMCTVLASVLKKSPIRPDVAMTGEITLRGEILPIGGLKEKLLAARIGGIENVIIPEENKKDLNEIPDNIKNEINIHAFKWVDQVLNFSLEKK